MQIVEMVPAEFCFLVVYSLNMSPGATVIQPYCATASCIHEGEFYTEHMHRVFV